MCVAASTLIFLLLVSSHPPILNLAARGNFLKWKSDHFIPLPITVPWLLLLFWGSNHTPRVDIPGPHWPSQSHPWPLISESPLLEPHRSEHLQERTCEDSRQLGKSDWKPCIQTHKIQSRSEGQTETPRHLPRVSLTNQRGLINFQGPLRCSLPRLSSCSPWTTLMRLVLSCPYRGECTLLSRDCPFQDNFLISKTQDGGFQALCPKLSCPGSRHA